MVKSVREAAAQACVNVVDLLMHAGVNNQRINVSDQAVDEISTQTKLLLLVEPENPASKSSCAESVMLIAWHPFKATPV
jgi:heptaprenylglyceryl phosphate synthase